MNKLIIITGTSRGIGKNLAQSYLDDGYIVVGCSRSKTSIIHTNYLHYCIDASDEKSVINMVREIGRIVE